MTDADLRVRRLLADRVNSELTRKEQETGITFYGDANRFEIITYSETIVRSLLAHDLANIDWIYIRQEGQPNARISSPSDAVEIDGDVEGVAANLPLGTLKIKGKARKHNHPSKIVSTPAESVVGVE